MTSNLRTIEKKALGSLLILSDNSMKVTASVKKIAETMGYKSSGGAITSAILMLEMKNYINIEEDGYEILL